MTDHKNDPYAEREARKYDSPVASREWLLELLEKGPLGYDDLCVAADATDENQREGIRRRLRAMVRDGQLLRNRKELYIPIIKSDLIQGRVIGHRDGFGFVKRNDGQEDLFLHNRQMRRVFDGDEVLVRLGPMDKRGRREGKIVEVLEHRVKSIVGRFVDEGGYSYVVPENQKIVHNIMIPESARAGALENQMVLVEITQYPDRRSMAKGNVVEVMGYHLDPGMEIEVAIHNHAIPNEWSTEAADQAATLSHEVSDADKQGRIDLRHLPLVTIDGEDARDFDDAVYATTKKSGGWRLYVAIADVSHYVQANSALDVEAFNRGNSTYFPGFVVPMLPEVLSNGLCSLNPRVDRLAMVCEMTIAKSGRVSGYKFYDAVIHSHARLTYTQVGQALKEREEGQDGLVRQALSEVVEHIDCLHDLYTALRQQRDERGAIDFDTVESRIVFGQDRKIETIVPVERNDAHKLIEECMLAANVCAAKLFEKAKLPSIYRVHEGPTAAKLETLRRYLGELGLHLQGGDTPEPQDYQNLLSQIQDRSDVNIIQTMMLRSMAQARYQPVNEGHFGLGYEAYTHFTSPIRRYPDLLVHRGIRWLIHNSDLRQVQQGDNVQAPSSYLYDVDKMLQAGEQCSMTERRSDDASRDVTAWLKCEYLQQHVGDAFPGKVATVTNFGLFVELNDLFVEGLIHIGQLDRDYYSFDQTKQRLIGERSGRTFNLGDDVMVRVARVDLDERKVDLELVDHETRRERIKKDRSGKASNSKTAPKKEDFTEQQDYSLKPKQNRKKSKKPAAKAKAGTKAKVKTKAKVSKGTVKPKAKASAAAKKSGSASTKTPRRRKVS